MPALPAGNGNQPGGQPGPGVELFEVLQEGQADPAKYILGFGLLQTITAAGREDQPLVFGD